MIGEVALFGLFTAISIQDALQSKLDDYLTGVLWLCYVFLFPGAGLYWVVVSFGLLVLITRYAKDCHNLGEIMGWGDVLAIPILLSFVIGIAGLVGGLIWLLLGMILGLGIKHVRKDDRIAMMPMLWISFLILELALAFKFF